MTALPKARAAPLAPPSRALASPGRHGFFFVSANLEWGGSEELWSRAAIALAEAGHTTKAMVMWRTQQAPPIDQLRALGCKVSGGVLPDGRRLRGSLRTYLRRLQGMAQSARIRWSPSLRRWKGLVVVSQGCNFDGARIAGSCRRHGLPYVLVAQKATEYIWPGDAVLAEAREAYLHARRSFFVSRHNLALTEHQLGIRIPHAEVVRNPFLVPWEGAREWPDSSGGLRLACVARLDPAEKGQDLILRVLARPKWRERPLHVTFVGRGFAGESLQGMARLLDLRSVSFSGFLQDIPAVWDTHHGLLLPSRAEGLPLAVVEAMLCGRPVILTDVAGHREVVEDGRTGFLASSPTEDAVDATLERAWARRHEWRFIGQCAARAIRALVPPDPAGVFAARLVEIAGSLRAAGQADGARR